MKNLLILLGILLSSPFVVAQHSAINGNVAIANNSPEGTRVVVIKNGNKLDEQVLNKKGHFDLKLAFDADYKISFEKTGYITKIISINTEVPEESIENNPDFPPVKLIINLLPSVEKIDLSIFDQPIAILTYQAELDDFTFDKSYSDKIKDRIAQTEQAVKKQLAARDAAAIEQERKFAELFNKGLESFGRKAWQAAIDSWTLAQNMKPGNKEVKQKIAEAQEQAKLEEARKSVEPQNEQTYRLLLAQGVVGLLLPSRLLLAAADSLFSREEYPAAKEKYASAKQIKTKEPYPQEQIRNIDRLLAEIAQKEAITQQQLAEAEATYQKTIAQADRSYQAQEYRQAITTYRQALALKSEEAYPRNMIGKAEQALAALEKQQADEAEKQRQEEERINTLKLKYTGIIAEADQAFKNENYSAAKLRYSEADQLNLGEDYPRKRLGEIEQIIHSSKYKARLAEYNKNKTLAEKNLEQKNYASAKVYFQKALTLSPADKESIRERIAETDRLIEAEQLAALDKAYQTNTDKADKAYAEKAYAIAKFYYQKALEIKIGDKHATERLQEIEKYIGEQQTKEAEL